MKKILVFASVLLLSACAWTQQMSAAQQRNAHTYYLDVLAKDLVKYVNLPTCSDAVTEKCKDVSYILTTVFPAEQTERKALANLSSAVDKETVTDSIQAEENDAFAAIEEIAIGDKIQTAIKE